MIASISLGLFILIPVGIILALAFIGMIGDGPMPDVPYPFEDEPEPVRCPRCEGADIPQQPHTLGCPEGS